MPNTTFTDRVTPILASWLNEVNDAVFEGQTVYTPAGTGAVPTTVQEKLREIVSVKDFGAIGDGVTDDTLAIQLAIDYLDSVGGGILQVPGYGAIYGISETIFVKTNIAIIGSGRPEIKAISPMVGAMFQFGYTDGAVLSPPTNPCYNSRLESIVVNANYNVTMENFGVGGLDSGVIYVWRMCPYNKVIDCEIKSAESGLVDVEDGADFFELVGCEIHDITTTSPTTQFINLVNIDGPTNAVVRDNDIYDLNISGYSPTSWGYGLRLHATDSSVAHNNKIDSGYHNILVDGRNNTVSSNRLSNPGSSGITLFQNDFGCRYNSIINNFINNDTTTFMPFGLGIREALSGTSPDSAKVTQNYIAGNTIANASTPLTILSTSGSYAVGNTSVTGNIQDGTASSQPTRNSINDTIKSGTYTPTLTNTSNIDASTAYECQYLRVGDVVTVSGQVDIDATAAAAIELRMTLPIASTFASANQLAGTAVNNFANAGRIYGLAASSLARLNATPTGTDNRVYNFTFTYRIV